MRKQKGIIVNIYCYMWVEKGIAQKYGCQSIYEGRSQQITFTNCCFGSVTDNNNSSSRMRMILTHTQKGTNSSVNIQEPPPSDNNWDNKCLWRIAAAPLSGTDRENAATTRESYLCNLSFQFEVRRSQGSVVGWHGIILFVALLFFMYLPRKNSWSKENKTNMFRYYYWRFFF